MCEAPYIINKSGQACRVNTTVDGFPADALRTMYSPHERSTHQSGFGWEEKAEVGDRPVLIDA